MYEFMMIVLLLFLSSLLVGVVLSMCELLCFMFWFTWWVIDDVSSAKWAMKVEKFKFDVCRSWKEMWR